MMEMLGKDVGTMASMRMNDMQKLDALENECFCVESENSVLKNIKDVSCIFPVNNI